jgi:hypothetical protein
VVHFKQLPPVRLRLKTALQNPRNPSLIGTHKFFLGLHKKHRVDEYLHEKNFALLIFRVTLHSINISARSQKVMRKEIYDWIGKIHTPKMSD